jgi:hypothetical protein
MAYRVTNYQQAFEAVLGIKYDDEMQGLVKRLEQEGHTEKSICFAVWKCQDKLSIFKGDSRFKGVFINEVNKWSWKKDDPRWKEYWKRKEEQKKAERVRRELKRYNNTEKQLELIEWRAKKPKKSLEGFIYFIQGEYGGAIKIGYSKDPARRLTDLQTGYPDTLKILLLIPGDNKMEYALHKELEGSRLKGEWFRPDKCVLDRIKDLAEKYAVNEAEATP